MKKSNYYIGVIIILLAANLLLFLSPKKSGADVVSGTFFGDYDLSQLEEIVFTNESDRISIKKDGDLWQLQDSLKVDAGFFNMLLSILERIQSTRKVNTWEGQVMGEINLKFSEVALKLTYGTNATQTKSYFINQGQVSEVSVPGYQDNVIDIFRLHPDQWRDRLVFDGSWRTIQKLKLNVYNQGDTEVTFQDKFFLLDGKQPQDSSALVDYLNQYQYFQANEMVSKGRFPALDSLISTEPLATITIDDINYKNQLDIIIYPKLQNQNYHLALSGNKMMVLDNRRVDNLLSLSDLSQLK